MDTIRSALFIDFDNIYGGLRADYDASVATSFATVRMQGAFDLAQARPNPKEGATQ